MDKILKEKCKKPEAQQSNQSTVKGGGVVLYMTKCYEGTEQTGWTMQSPPLFPMTAEKVKKNKTYYILDFVTFLCLIDLSAILLTMKTPLSQICIYFLFHYKRIIEKLYSSGKWPILRNITMLTIQHWHTETVILILLNRIEKAHQMSASD